MKATPAQGWLRLGTEETGVLVKGDSGKIAKQREPSQAEARFKTLLRELFQLDQAELDFGVYRILRIRQKEIERFIEKDLAEAVGQAFEAYQHRSLANLERDLKEAIAKAKGVVDDPEQSKEVKQIRAKIAVEAVDVPALEDEVFSHLYAFFRRYYDEGDFISQRRYKDDVYAIPYQGEEVKLHWANHDQYYVKTSEDFQTYAFLLPSRRKVRFVVTAAESGNDNSETPANNGKRFVLAEKDPLAVDDDVLEVRFEYQGGKEKTRQATLNDETRDRILKAKEFDDWVKELSVKAPTETEPDRTLLEKHLSIFTKRNTFDYFIHKDLGRFLRRELDFYVKNEIMHLDDVLEDGEDRLTQRLSKVKVFREIGERIIGFLAQIEDFQKKIWLKKKFVLETQYCFTLDRVPKELYTEIAKNDAQREEWVALYAIDKVLTYSKPLKPDFLETNQSLVLDTRHFDAEFKERLLGSVENLDDSLDGLLIHGDNFHALDLLLNKYSESLKCIYIDPPYNTGSDEFTYKDNYQHSSWLSMMHNRIRLMQELMRTDGTFFTSINYVEIAPLKKLLDDLFQTGNFEGIVTWRRRHNQPNDRTKMIGQVAEYLLAYAKDSATLKRSGVGKVDLTGKFSNPDNDPRGDWASKPWKVGSDQSGSRYVITTPSGKTYDEEWMGDEDTYKALLEDKRIVFPNGKSGAPRKKYFKSERQDEGQCASNWWDHASFGHNQGANTTMSNLFGVKNLVSNPKPVELIRGVIQVSGKTTDSVADFFAGSGTTGHAVLELNREEGQRRKYILGDMADYFDDVMLPRIKKVVYAKDWKDGKPTSRDTGISHAFKYLRLESYEDALANVRLTQTPGQQTLLDKNPELRSEYVLRYMLGVESRDSPSLLNAEAFEDPQSYELTIARDGEKRNVKVDLLETFNWLLGLKVDAVREDDGLRYVTGTDREGTKILVVWRNVKKTDNESLNDWFKKQGFNSTTQDFDTVYVNGSSTLASLRGEKQTWQVKLTEAAFHRLMFQVEDV